MSKRRIFSECFRPPLQPLIREKYHRHNIPTAGSGPIQGRWGAFAGKLHIGELIAYPPPHIMRPSSSSSRQLTRDCSTQARLDDTLPSHAR